ncbi:MAG: cysteine desulfurase [Cyclobacteriaceae bacterium]|nr:cysteine desulfurase [Cyclobacteriaceae bacterium]
MDVYLDNAATTPLDPEVISEMSGFMERFYGNPSSTHFKGRETRVELEKARKKIASIVGAAEKEIIFTSGGTEANNFILKSLSLAGELNRIISSPIEHHSVLDSLEWISKNTKVKIHYLSVDEKGNCDLEELEKGLKAGKKTLVSLMHGNNEIGNLLDLKKVGDLCLSNNALFHTDMVQTLGHYPISLNALPIDFASASAHKIHGPKGSGFLYIKNKAGKLRPYFHGGAQERGLRGGTENILGIIGMAKAFEVARNTMDDQKALIAGLKNRMIEQLNSQIPSVQYNGLSGQSDGCMYNILNVQLPGPYDNTLLFNLDLMKIAVSEGSACSSGASEGSHVLRAMGQSENNFNNIRISFSKMNTTEEIDYAAKAIAKVYRDLLE